jgi:imidazolonepropionase
MDGAQSFDLVRDGAVGMTKGKVAWIGHAANVPAGGAGKTWNIGGKVLTPGLVDPHTHIRLWRGGAGRFRGAGRRHALGLDGRGGGVSALTPPGDTGGAADFVRRLLEGEGIAPRRPGRDTQPDRELQLSWATAC